MNATSRAVLVDLCDALAASSEPVDLDQLRKICARHGVLGHLAIFAKPYVKKLLTGEKAIESRFSKRKIAPFGTVQPGDVVLVKEGAGPIRAAFIVDEAEYYSFLDPGKAGEIIAEHAEALCADDDYRTAKRDSRFGTLLWLSETVETMPVFLQKRDRRSWIVLNKYSQLVLFRDEL